MDFNSFEVWQEGVLCSRSSEEGLSLCATSPGLQELRKLQGELVSAAGGPAPDPDEVFYPHVSLGYFSQEISEEALSDALDLADLHPIVVVSPRLSLIELGRDDRMYTRRTRRIQDRFHSERSIHHRSGHKSQRRYREEQRCYLCLQQTSRKWSL